MVKDFTEPFRRMWTEKKALVKKEDVDIWASIMRGAAEYAYLRGDIDAMELYSIFNDIYVQAYILKGVLNQ